MFSSKVQEIKQGAHELAKDITDKVETVTDEVTEATAETLHDAKQRVGEEGEGIKRELDGLFAKIHDLLRPGMSQELRQQVRSQVDELSRRASAWAEEQEAALSATWTEGRLRTQRTLSERPLLSLAIAAGAGAVIAYWLTHRSNGAADSEQQ